MSELTLPVSEQDHIGGSPDAPVTLVEYGDYECLHCKAAFPNVKALQMEFGADLCLVYRHFPLVQVHPHAELAAEAAEAAEAQGRFWEMHDTLFRNSPALQTPELLVYAAELGLDLPLFGRELAAQKYAIRVRRDVESGVLSGVRATPTFFINGIRHEGGYDLATLAQALHVSRPR